MTILTHKVTGLLEARRLLKELPANTQKRVLVQAVRAGASVLRSELRTAAPSGGEDTRSKASKLYGHLKNNIRILRLKKNIPVGSAMFRVDTGNSFWGWMLEFGTKKMAARPWFRPAVDRAWDTAVNTIKERLGVGIQREADKLVKR